MSYFLQIHFFYDKIYITKTKINIKINIKNMDNNNKDNFDVLNKSNNDVFFNENNSNLENINSSENAILSNLDSINSSENIDILSNLSTQDNIDDELKTIKINEIESNISKKIWKESDSIIMRKRRNSFMGWIMLFSKYILTSTLIFAILLVTTNYNAYYNIAKNFVFQWDAQSTQQRLISSVEASNIKDKYSKVLVDEIKEEKVEADKLSIKKMIKEQNKNNINLDIEITPYENRVIIPQIGENIPLLDVKNREIKNETELNDIFMEELERWIVRYPGTAKPWEKGTSFIFGHSSNFPWVKWDYNEVFALLNNVELNDEIIVYYDQEKYIYKITGKKIVTPWDVSVLKGDENKSEIILMTCWPIGTTLNRLIVIWELVKQ